MKSFLLLTLIVSSVLGAVVDTFVDEDGRIFDHHVGTYLTRSLNNGLYRVTYDMQLLGSNFITNLDEVAGIHKVTCDVNDIEMIIDFNSIPEAYALYQRIKDEGYEKYLTSLKYNCTNSKTKPFVNIKQILTVELNSNQILIRTALGSYENLFRQGQAKVEAVEESEGYTKNLCFGANANTDCTAGIQPIPIYKNDYISLTCSDCFVGAKATAFFEFKVSWFKLRHVGAGLKNIGVNGAFVLEMKAQASASGGIDKTLNTVATGLVLQFYIGPVPIVVWYEIPLRLVANTAINAQAFAKAGVKATWRLGDAFVEWDERTGWKRGRITPSFSWNHVLDGDVSFNADASLSICPSFVLHVINIVEAGLVVEPTLLAKAEGNIKTKQLCAEMLYKIIAKLYAKITMNLPLIKLKEIKFGPYELLNTGEKTIGKWCIKKNTNELE